MNSLTHATSGFVDNLLTDSRRVDDQTIIRFAIGQIGFPNPFLNRVPIIHKSLINNALQLLPGRS